ncbi:MAG: hypothetical protein QM581_06340 [Pseudomonas sp.]
MSADTPTAPSASNVIALPTAAAEPVANPKRKRGRPPKVLVPACELHCRRVDRERQRAATRSPAAMPDPASIDEITRDLHAGATLFLRMVWSARDRAGLPALQEPSA